MLKAKVLCVTIIICLCQSCQNNKNSVQQNNVISTKVKCQYAKGFSIQQYNQYTIVKVYNPWQNANNIKLIYLLYHKSKPHPNDSIEAYIQVPIKKAICLSSTYIAFIEALNELNSIIGISGVKLIYNSQLRNEIEKGNIFEVGYENNLEYEKIIQSQPDVVFVYGIGSESNGYMLKLKELGIPVVLVGEYLEEHPLARTEWIKFFASFYNKGKLAKQYYDSVANLYNTIREKALLYENKPKIMMALPWNGNWFISGAKTYMGTLINDAGGEYIWNDLKTNISMPLSFEYIFNKSKNADIWINIGQATDKQYIAMVDKRLTLLKPFRTDKLYNNNARTTDNGGNDYWESGVLHPDIILKDLYQIFHLQQIPTDSLYYYKKLN